MKASKRGAFFMALFVAVSSVLPVRDSRAAVPLVGLAVAAISNTGAVVTADLLTSGVTALIGGSIAALAITPNNADAPMRVALMSDQPTIDAVMPPPSNPGSVQPSQDFKFCGGTMSAQQCCSQTVSIQNSSWSSWGGSCGGGGVSGSGASMNCSFSCSDSMGTQQFNTGMWGEAVNTCPSGSVWNGSSCTVTVPREAVKDSKKDFVPSPSGFSPTYDPDSMPSYGSSSGGIVYAQGKNSSGQPVMIKYAVSADGQKAYITHYTQSEDATQTTVKTQSITVNTSTGAVESATAGTTTGAISPASGAGSVPTVSTGTAVTSGNSSSEPIVFPSDYARVGEAAQAAQVVKTAVDGVKERLTTTETVTDPLVPEWVDPWGMTWDGLKGWRLPSHASACPSGSFSWNGSLYLINGHCQLFTDYFAEFSAVMVVIWSVLALFIVLGA